MTGRKNPPVKNQFKKGQSGNPAGSRKHDPLIKKLRNLTKTELVEVGNLVVQGTVEELRSKAKDPKATVIQTMVASVAVRIMSKGDMSALNLLLDRLVGKVRDDVHVTGDAVPGSRVVIVELPDNGRRAPSAKP